MKIAPLPPERAAPAAGVTAEIVAMAREYESERTTAATLAPEPERSALIALAGYAADLVRIGATATQPMLGEIRLQWWRDSLETIAKGERVGSPLADALGAAITDFAIPVPALAAMSEARAWDLYDDRMPDAASLDGYLAKTEALPFELSLRVLGVAAGDAGSLAKDAGRAFGLARLLARLPTHLAAGRMPLPPSLLAEYGVTAQRLVAGHSSPEMKALVAGCVRGITATVTVLRPRIRALSRRQRVALLPLAVLSPYLRAIERGDRDPTRDIAELAPLTRVWRIGISHSLGRF